MPTTDPVYYPPFYIVGEVKMTRVDYDALQADLVQARQQIVVHEQTIAQLREDLKPFTQLKGV